LAAFLGTLSTAARFRRFERDFRHEEGDGIAVRREIIDDVEHLVLTHGDLCEFLAKKDYLASWKSEMHEKFCFYSHEEWCDALRSAGFEITPASRAVVNTWLLEHRFDPAGTVYASTQEGMQRVAPPVTNTLLIARKPLV